MKNRQFVERATRRIKTHKKTIYLASIRSQAGQEILFEQQAARLFVKLRRLARHCHPWREGREPSLAFSRLPADGVLFEVGVHSAAYGRIEVCGAEAFK